jgi:hypothetical protein
MVYVPDVALIVEATVGPGVAIPALAAALQTQAMQHFAPNDWGVGAHLHVIPKGQAPPPAWWQLVLLDDADQADALGYHDVTAAGKPLGKVFVKTSLDDGQTPSSVASHELLEMLGDPSCNLWATAPLADTKADVYAFEACDAVEGQPYQIDGVTVSNFVTRPYFEAFRAPHSTKFDYHRSVGGPAILIDLVDGLAGGLGPLRPVLRAALALAAELGGIGLRGRVVGRLSAELFPGAMSVFPVAAEESVAPLTPTSWGAVVSLADRARMGRREPLQLPVAAHVA